MIIDLFATYHNCRSDAFFAPTLDPIAVGTDAMLQCWSNMQVYGFPPFSMIRLVINKLRQSKGTTMTLITPMWRQREWFPDLLELSIEPPFPLPQRIDLLTQSLSRLVHPNLSMPGLHAWRLSSPLPSQQAILQESQDI